MYELPVSTNQIEPANTKESLTLVVALGNGRRSRLLTASILKQTRSMCSTLRDTGSEIGVVKPTDGRDPYLRTYADGDWNNNLLALPECS